jgi:hypothetical protein
MCLFETQNAELAKKVNEAARIGFTRLATAEDLSPLTS